MEYILVLKWVVILFAFTLGIGIIAPMSGVGGGVLFVPLATAFFPFSVDFIRGAGLLIAMTSSLSSVPHLISRGFANISLMIPLALVSTLTSVVGGVVGLWLTNTFPQGEAYFTVALGFVLLFIFTVMVLSKRIEYPKVREVGRISKMLDLKGAWYEPSLDEIVEYKTNNLLAGMLSFGVVGFVGGMFGLGSGWANVPVLNLIMRAPIKISVATSMAMISVNAAAASWIYIARGATLPVICIPSVLGITIGARIGARLAEMAKPVFIKYMVMGIMIFAAAINILKGMRGAGII